MARNGSRLPPASVMGVRKEDGIVPMEERLVATDISRYKLVRSNWFAYNPMRLNIGSIARWQGDSVVLVSPDYVVFRCLEQSTPAALHPEYLDHFRSSSQWDAFVNEAGDGGVRVRIYYRDISQLRLIVPDVVEQQKISDCLGSLDDLIAAEGRKLEALRQHKQGLMQQLFPQPGQSRPRLRFPEFRNAVEWQRCALGEIAEISKGKGISKSDVVQRGRTPCVRYGELYTSYGEIIEIVKSRTNLPASDLVLSNAGDVIIPASGETKEDIATCACVVDDGVALGSDLNVIRSPVDGRFFSYYLNGSRRRELAKVAQGDTVAHLYPTQLSRLEVYIPDAKAEQQRIADCLSSLDARLAAQVQKLNALKTHKQGLLQQIFPSLESH